MIIFVHHLKIREMYLGWAPGPWEIILVVLVVLLLFGGRKIPELMRGLGKGVKEFKEGIAEDDKKDTEESKDKKEEK
jgi:sec-independent protein translocase protein TatA